MLTAGTNNPNACHNCPAQDEMRLLTRRIGHDLRAPLRALQILPEWIAEEFESADTNVPSQATEYLDMITSKAAQMDALLAGLLQFALVASPESSRDSIDPRAEIQKMAQSILAAGTYEIEIASELSGIKVVHDDFCILFNHLMTNAIRHQGEGTAYVRIKGHLHNQTAVFYVEDNGPGIEEKFHQRIFEPFATLKPRDEVEGSGLGLAVVRKIADWWHGDISVRSKPGLGTVLRLQFPAEFPT